MDIKELPLRVAQLERDISAATQKLIYDFKEDTALQVADVSIDIHRIEAMGQPANLVVGDTKVTLDI